MFKYKLLLFTLLIFIIIYNNAEVYRVVDYNKNIEYRKIIILKNFKGDNIGNCYLYKNNNSFTAVDSDDKIIIISSKVNKIGICSDVLIKKEFYILSLLDNIVVRSNVDLFKESSIINNGELSIISTPVVDNRASYTLYLYKEKGVLEIEERRAVH